jgi:hypothetical protein
MLSFNVYNLRAAIPIRQCGALSKLFFPRQDKHWLSHHSHVSPILGVGSPGTD